MHHLTDDIKNEARHLGFEKVGIARAQMLDEEARHLQEWLARGYHGTMQWMSNKYEKRINPQEILPDAKSVIAVAMNYYAAVDHDASEDTGKISRYAWGDDYHRVLSDRLQLLLEVIKQKNPKADGKVYVDTGPVMDKVWAQRAGIGWQGKHTNLITEEYGSWVFLGEIILNLELEYDEPGTDQCGSCTLCIEACPTQAIVEPYVVDANLCISYQTIEHRGEIAIGLGEKFDRWIYGCDICQDVCPWNQKFSRQTQRKEFEPREYNVEPRLEAVVALTQEEFSRQFRKSPVKRTKLTGLVRNATIALSTQQSRALKDERHG